MTEVTRKLHLLFSDHVTVGAVVLGGPVLALVLGTVAIVVSRQRAPAAWLARSGVASLGAALAAIVALAIGAYRPLVHQLPPWPLSAMVKLELAAIAQEMGTAAAAVASIVLTAAFIVRVRGRERLRYATAGALATIVFGLAAWDAKVVLDAAYGECTGLGCRYAALVDATAAPTAFARTLVLAVGIGFIAIGTAVRLRENAIASTRRVAYASALFIAGAGFFVATRPLAADADSPVPLWDDDFVVGESSPPDLPPAPGHCVSTWAGTDLELGDRLHIDGAPSISLGRELSAKLALATAMGTHDPAVSIGASPTRPARDVNAVVGVARGAGFVHVFGIAVKTRPPVETRTLGSLARARRSCLVALDEHAFDGDPATWGEVVARAGR